MTYQQRLNYAIPGGAHTYSRGFDQFPSNAPQILEKGKDAYVWDVENNQFLDYGMALRAVTLGYANLRVNAAAIKQIENGNNLTRPSVIELEAAELFTSLIPGAHMVKFAKNGSNVTTAAVKVARAFTRRRYVCIPRQHPFFSFDDWFIGTTPLQRGIPQEYISSTLLFDYNDITSLEHLFDEYPDKIAAVMLEPATTTIPCPSNCIEPTADPQCISCPNRSNNFLHQVQNLCRNEGALFILDEMITGFRWSLQGAGYYFNVTPDLMTFGKAMANGFSVSALAGRRDIMEVGAIDKQDAERTFLLSTTHGGEMCGLGAFIETMSIYEETDVCRHLWDYGAKLKAGMNNIASDLGIDNFFEVIGPSISLHYVTRDTQGLVSAPFRTLFAQEMIKSNVLMPWIAISLSHTDKELMLTLDACYSALQIYKEALIEGVDKYLVGSEIKPVFRKFN